MSDLMYPIYRIRVLIQRRGENTWGDKIPQYWPSVPPVGFIWDSTSFYQMYKDDPGNESVEKWTEDEWLPSFINEKEYKDVVEYLIEVTGPKFETWCLEWFSHKTFDVGQTDEEAIASFERYVGRYAHMQDLGYDTDAPDYICLMGAEDRWRWHGEGRGEDRNPPPCRCEHCRAQGVLRIGH